MWTSPLELFLSHHFFVPVFGSANNLTVGLSRPIKVGVSNPNFVCNTFQDFLVLLSVWQIEK
jgi:hypothetical protein